MKYSRVFGCGFLPAVDYGFHAHTGRPEIAHLGLIALEPVFGILLGRNRDAGEHGEQSQKEFAFHFISIMILLAAANTFGWIVSYLRIPNKVATFILSVTQNKIVILILINLVLLVLGCVMSMSSLLLIVTPIVVPILQQMDYSLVQFGIVMILNLGIGLLTPPVGSALYVGSAVSGLSVGKLGKSLLPFYLVMVIALILLTFIPALTTFLL